MSQTSLGTCRWINKAHISTGIYSCSMRGTNIAKVEGQWCASNWPNHSVPETQMTASRLLCTFLLYPIPRCMSRVIMTSPNYIRIICFPISGGKALYMHGESLGFACTCTSIPAYYFLLLCKNPVMFSITQISRLWHSPPGIMVHSHTGALNLLIEHDIYSQKIDM